MLRSTQPDIIQNLVGKKINPANQVENNKLIMRTTKPYILQTDVSE